MERNILICGDPGVGKSTLIDRLLAADGRPVSGFRTRKLPPGPDGICEVILFPAAEGPGSETVRIGRCRDRILETDPQAFETLGVRLIREARPGTILVMDELGRMESEAAAFQREVLKALDGPVPVLAAVKSLRNVPFLDRIRESRDSDLYRIDRENRDALAETLLREIRERKERRERADR